MGAVLKGWITSTRWPLGGWTDIEPLVLAQVHARNLRHLWLGAWVSLPVYALAAAWLLMGGGADWAELPLWRRMVGLTHLSGVPVALAAGLLLGPVVRQATPPTWTRWLVVPVVVFYLAQGVAITAFYQWVSPKVTPMMVVCFGSAVMFQLRPWLTLALYGAAMLAGLLALPLTQPDRELLLSAQASAVIIPLSSAAVALVLWFQSRESILLAESLAQANQQLQLKQAQLEHMALRDGLTGLYNRAEFIRQAELELQRAARAGVPTTFVMLDLDHFKAVNDRWGHPAGDQVLRHVADLLQRRVRSADLVARLGGEEFVVMLCATAQEPAQRWAEALRQAVELQPTQVDNETITHTLSLGLVSVAPASSPQPAMPWSQVYAAVDAALYHAKALGRNQVCVGHEPGIAP